MRQEPEAITDTVLVGFEPDGAPVYMSEEESRLTAIGNCAIWLVQHPREALHALGMAALGGACGFLAYEGFRKPEPKRKPRRRTLRSKVKR
jgi:hypothetical protein